MLAYPDEVDQERADSVRILLQEPLSKVIRVDATADGAARLHHQSHILLESLPALSSAGRGRDACQHSHVHRVGH